MDAAAKRRTAERVRRALTKMLAPRGFVRGKSTFWVRPKQHVVEFLHLHLFTFGPVFRAHSGIRVLNDAFEAPALNGPSSDDCGTETRRTYNLDFAVDDASIARCASEITRFCSEVAEPWFERFGTVPALIAVNSPLNDQERRNLEQSAKDQADPENFVFSKKLLGVA